MKRTAPVDYLLHRIAAKDLRSEQGVPVRSPRCAKSRAILSARRCTAGDKTTNAILRRIVGSTRSKTLSGRLDLVEQRGGPHGGASTRDPVRTLWEPAGICYAVAFVVSQRASCLTGSLDGMSYFPPTSMLVNYEPHSKYSGAPKSRVAAPPKADRLDAPPVRTKRHEGRERRDRSR